MPTYAYEAMDHAGKEVKDTIDASTQEEAQQLIRQKGFFVTKISERAAKGGKKKPAQAKKGKGGRRKKSFTIGKDAAIDWQASLAFSNRREPTRTAAPARANSRTTRWPTGPVAPSTAAVVSAGFTCLSTASTAAVAVVLAPLASIITDTRIGPKKVRFTSSSSASPAATLEPPMKIAVCFSSSGPRVKIAP